jgi:6-phosphogluconolactonase
MVADAFEKPLLVYIGTYTGTGSKGIYVSRFDPASGKLSAAELAVETKNPSFLAIHPSRHFLYSVGEIDEFNGKRSGAVSAFEMEADGKLTMLNQQPSGGAGPCHLAVDGTGKCVLVANYGSGSFAALPIEADGRLTEPIVTIQHRGSSVNPQRQSGAHAHFITTDPNNRFALACDLGLDKVFVYRLNTGIPGSLPVLVANDPPWAAVKPGSGPRHLAFHPNGRYVYLVNEMGWSLTAFSYDARRGALEELQTISTVPEKFTGENLAAEVQVHPSGKFVYVSNRGHNSIAVFGIDDQSGRLTYVEHQSTGGKTPRHFAIDPSGNWLLAENQESNNIVVFRIDSKTGRLSATGQTVEVGSPVFVAFVPVK